ncbi:myelin-associated glycoprotein isoform X4 [Gadus morhua]|uniref:myelin-associated glycoprotein isoform X4 n=1 Tax=Gadus morhua TaxID=8049 RepID=UPI0011B82A56|nr:myelin-associated glycoprotein-like isoform X4 [Gadus morhua]
MLEYMFELKEDSVKNMEGSIFILLLWCHLQGVGGQSWTVFLPQSVKGLQGSCVRIPCSFTLEWGWDTYLDHTCKAQWFKDFRRDPVFDSSLEGYQNLYQGELVGNLLNRNCTTIFHNLPVFKSELFFRIDCRDRLKYNYATGVVVDVKDVWNPVLNPKGRMEAVEGRPVMLSCSAQILCPYRPTLSWTPSLGDTQETVEDELVTSVLTFNASALHHRQRITCSSLYKRNTGLSDATFKQYLTINVLYPPDNVSVEWPSSPVLEGSYVRLRCKGSANPTVDLYAWYRSRLNPGTDQGPSERHAEGPLGFSRSINVSVSADAQYFCEVGNLYGAKNTSLTQMVVHYPPREVEPIHFAAEILNSSHCVRLPSGVLCSCESQGNPVPTLTWTLDGEAVDHSAHRPIREYKSGNLGVMSVISLPQSDKDPPTVMCLSNNSGDNRLDLNLAFFKSEPDWAAFHTISLLIGLTAGSLVMMLLCTLFHMTLSRKKRDQLSENTNHRNPSELALALVEEAEVVYGNNAVLDAVGGKEEELQYVDLSFILLQALTAANPGVDLIRGMDSKTDEYAEIRPHPTGSGEGEPQEEEVYAECVSYGQTSAGEEVMAEGSLIAAKDSETES